MKSAWQKKLIEMSEDIKQVKNLHDLKELQTISERLRTELKRVNWPTYSTLYAFTLVTIVTIAFFTIFIFGMDFSFKNSLINLLIFGE